MNCQINMKINSMQSDLLEVVSLVGEELGRWEERKQRHLQLLEALLGLTQKAPSQAEEGFTTQELRDEVSRIINKPWGNDENQAKVVSQHWSKLEAVWDKKREGLRQRAAAQNLAGFPVLRKTTGGGGGYRPDTHSSFRRLKMMTWQKVTRLPRNRVLFSISSMISNRATGW